MNAKSKMLVCTKFNFLQPYFLSWASFHCVLKIIFSWNNLPSLNWILKKGVLSVKTIWVRDGWGRGIWSRLSASIHADIYWDSDLHMWPLLLSTCRLLFSLYCKLEASCITGDSMLITLACYGFPGNVLLARFFYLDTSCSHSQYCIRGNSGSCWCPRLDLHFGHSPFLSGTQPKVCMSSFSLNLVLVLSEENYFYLLGMVLLFPGQNFCYK